VQIEIWSDIACPWCYVGKRRFEAALAGFEHRDEVEVMWRAFELDPAAPAEREGDLAERLAEKYGASVEQMRASQAQLTQVAAADGLDFHFDAVRSGNTFDAHRLVHLGAAHGLQDAVEERLMRAYQSEGELMSDPAALERLGVDAGLPAGAVRALLAGDDFADAVRDDERIAAALGISAVPFFVADRRFGVSGAQSPEVLGQFLRQAWEARPQVEVVAGGDACGADGC
jgi:predicted DsbA family dithiol-disulfide isomerase